MTDQRSSDEELLQGRLDGTLTAEESARLDVRLTESAPLRLRAAQLTVLAEALASVKTSDPAPALGPRVMSQIHPRVESISGRRASIAARQEAGMSQAGISKKVVWGLATAAAVVLGVWLVKGSSDAGGPTAGTVGVAKRYAAPQISDADVKLDASLQTVQAFLDSEAFGRVMTDPEAIALLGDPAVRAAIGARAANRDTSPSPISNAAISAVIDDPSFVVLVTNPTFESSWVDAAHSVAEAKSAAGATQLASQGAAGLASQGAAGLASQNAAGLNGRLASQGAAGLASQGAAGVASQNAAGLNTRLASQSAAGVASQGAAGLASQNAAGLNTRLASQSAAGVASQGAAGLASQNAAGLNTRLASQSAAGLASQGAAGLASQNAAGLNTRLASQNAAGLASQGAAGPRAAQNAAGVNARLASQSAAALQSQLASKLQSQLRSQLQSQLQSQGLAGRALQSHGQ